MRFPGMLALALLVSFLGSGKHAALAAEPVENSKYTYTYEEKEDASGVYHFNLSVNDASGKKAAAVAFEDEWGGGVSGVSLSPDGTTLAMLFGMECGTAWRFFDFPSGKAIGEPVAGVGGFAWIDGKTAAFSHSRDLSDVRACEAQCCLGLSVVRYPVGGELDFLAEVTPECDFELEGKDGAALLAAKTCMSLGKWRAAESGKPESVRIDLK